MQIEFLDGTSISLQASGWGATQVTLRTSTGMGSMEDMSAGFIHGTTSESTLSLDPGMGWLQLVTPTQVTTTDPDNNTEKIALFTTLRIQFIPEPGRLAAALTGVAAIALLASRRLRPRDRAESTRNH